MKDSLNGRQYIVGAFFLLAVLSLRQGAEACPIPVFQFSLEYWDADAYEIEVQYKEELTDEMKSAFELLREAEKGGERHANIKLIWRDYSDSQVSPPAGRELPYMEVRYPQVSGIREPIWSGPLEKSSVEKLLHSGMRQRIAERLLDRYAAVWLFLESGDRRADRAARRLLEEELPRLEKTLKVPDPGSYGIDMGDIHTEINFKLLALRRDDPDEQMLIRMLLGSERDLRDFDDKPMVFPIYGRGLIMYALVGEGINRWTLSSAGEFLTGPCSCQIKAGNPGVDMLMSIDWDSQVEQRSTYRMPGMPDAGGFMERMENQKE